MKKIKVIVVDDSKFIRTLFENLLNSAPDLEVVDVAEDPYDAREKIKRHNPDVITLDVEMPKMDGLEFLEKIMKLRPMPVVMVSSLTQRGADVTLQALEIGAVDYIAKPTDTLDHKGIDALKEELINKVRAAAGVNIISPNLTSRNTKVATTNLRIKKVRSNFKPNLIAIGASTGGVEAIKEIITNLGVGMPPIVITQHMPEKFTLSFAKRLNACTELTVHEASNGMSLEANNVYIAPGNKHMRVTGDLKSGLRLIVREGPLVSGHRPSVDAMFHSIAELTDIKVVAVILTGMGSDGAEGLLKLKTRGAHTIAQSAETCVVYGMPKVANEIGAADEQISLYDIAGYLTKLI